MRLTSTSLAEHEPREATVLPYSKRPFADGPPAGGGALPACRCEAEPPAGSGGERPVRGCFFQYPPLPSCSAASEEPAALLPFIPRFVKTVERLTWAAAAVPLRPRPCLSAPAACGPQPPPPAPVGDAGDAAEAGCRTPGGGGPPCCGRRDCRGGGTKRAKCRRAADDARESPRAGFRCSPETGGSIGVGPVSPSSAVATAVAMPTFVGAAEILRSLSRLYPSSPAPSRSGRRGRRGCEPAHDCHDEDDEHDDGGGSENDDKHEYDYVASGPPPPTPADARHCVPRSVEGWESYPSAWSSSLSSATLVLDDADPQQQQSPPSREEATRCYYSFPRPETHEPFECVAVRLNELLPGGVREQQRAGARRLSRPRNHHHQYRHHHHHLPLLHLHHRNSAHAPPVTDTAANSATKSRAAASRGRAC